MGHILAAMRLLVPLFCLFFALVTPAKATESARDVAGTHVADHIYYRGQNLVLNGAGLRRILFFKAYVAALYLPNRQREPQTILSPDVPRSLRVTLLRDMDTKRNIAALKGGLIDNNSPAELEAVQSEVDQFFAFLKGVEEVPAGTIIHLDYVPGEGTQVNVNDRHLGTIPGEAFNRALLKIWLGDDPVQGSLKKALLGG